ncbi:MAG: Crp/Fnr family transcriptional regulator [Enterobacterales bacterium]|nr:Crp/Fnr family transcriptional regulator [Enterobacterales bacterium]
MTINTITACLDPVGREIIAKASQIEIAQGSQIFRQGDPCKNYILVLDGSVKVLARTHSGREILLYRVKSGESCTLTTSCLFSDDRYPAEGLAETAVTALVVSQKDFNHGLACSERFRQFVFSAYGERIREVISLVETISFGKIETRLADALLQEAADSCYFKVTHQELAVDLGTAREVVSRQLKEFEESGWLELHRGAIKILDSKAIAAIAKQI